MKKIFAAFFLVSAIIVSAPVWASGKTDPRSEAALLSFLASDKTNEEAYTPEHNCVAFSAELISHLQAAGWDARFVVVMFSTDKVYGHAFVQVHTSDKGILWVEPQTDDIYRTAHIGEPLCFYDGRWCHAGTITVERTSIKLIRR